MFNKDTSNIMGDEVHVTGDINNNWFTAEERSIFIEVDRIQENKDVDIFQKTHDNVLFEKIYNARIPTLQIWARKNQSLSDSKEDMFCEFSVCFRKAVVTYKKGKGSFNTWLFKLLQNHKNNMHTSRKAKKRMPEGFDPNTMGKFMLSLDYSYDKNGSENTLKDRLANELIAKEEIIDQMIISETVDIMSGKNPVIAGFLKRLSDGNTIASLLKEYKTKKGEIHISKKDYVKLNRKKKQKKIVSELIKNNTSIQDEFMVLDYNLSELNKLNYTIEMKKTKETDLFMRTIRKLRKNENSIRVRIAI